MVHLQAYRYDTQAYRLSKHISHISSYRIVVLQTRVTVQYVVGLLLEQLLTNTLFML
jgi:hypothetical protein